ncbi:MAG: helix-turn-helix domain-containing protein [Clostridia bacterium]|nr:helix-turn-helix domain-containing protein [Clostridia bacterium]
MKRIFESKEEPLVGFIENHESWSMQAQHYHNTMEIYLLTQGDKEMIINGEKLIMNAGDLVIVRPFELHYSKKHTAPLISRYIISISEDMLKDYLNKEERKRLFSSLKNCKMTLKQEDIELLQQYWKTATLYHRSNDPLKIKISKFLVVQILMMLSEIEGEDFVEIKNESNFNEEMMDIIKYIDKNYKKPEFGLESVLEYSYMSKSKFCSIFKDTFKTTFLKYVTSLRIIAVRKALRETDKPLEIISEENGFMSLQTMTRNFIEEFGMTPAKYRKEFRNKN